jgi:5'-3' exonuclease
MGKLAIIDGDALIYHSSKDSIHESIEIIDEKIQNIFIQTGATHYVLFISNSPYFRHKISPDYKSNRNKYKSPLKWLKTLKKYLIEEWGAQSMDLVEADDLCAYWMNKDLCIADDGKIEPREVFVDVLDYCAVENLPQFEFESMEKVLCAVDKDLLQSIPGKHYNYTYKLEDKDNPNSVIKGWWVETAQEDVTDFYGKQLLMGDSADGIPALNGVGEARAAKMLQNWQDGMLETFILDYYIGYYKGNVPKAIFEFQKTYRLLHMLDCDEDFMREVGQLPELPEIRKVNFKPLIPEVDDDLTF